MAGKIRYYHLSSQAKKTYLDEFYKIVDNLRGREESHAFFKGMLTISEKIMLVRRTQIGKLLVKSWTHTKIKEKLGVGWNTISQVEKWLDESLKSYVKLLKKAKIMKPAFEQAMSNRGARYSVFDEIRHRYPADFALLNLLMMDKEERNRQQEAVNKKRYQVKRR